MTKEERKNLAKRHNICVVCGKEVGEGEAYCDEHRAEGNANDRRLMEEASTKPFVALAAAVAEQVMDDYRAALNALADDPFSNTKQGNVLRWRRYVRSDDFAALTAGVVEAERVIHVTEDTVMLERKQKEEAKHDALVERIEKLEKEVEKLEEEIKTLRELINGTAARCV